MENSVCFHPCWKNHVPSLHISFSRSFMLSNKKQVQFRPYRKDILVSSWKQPGNNAGRLSKRNIFTKSNNVKFSSEKDTFKDKLPVQQQCHLFFRVFFDQFQGMSSITRIRFNCLLLLLSVMTLLLVGKQILQRNLKSSKRQDTDFLTEPQAGV